MEMDNHIKLEDDSNQVEITIEDIIGEEPEDPSEDDDDYKFNLQSIKKLTSDVQGGIRENGQQANQKEVEGGARLIKVKSEPLDEDDQYESRIKTEMIDNIKVENPNEFEDITKKCGRFNNNNNNNDNNTSMTQIIFNDVKQEFEESGDLSDGFDYFTENCVKSKNDSKSYPNEVGFLGQEREYAVIKEDMDFEDHCVKSEPETIKAELNLNSNQNCLPPKLPSTTCTTKTKTELKNSNSSSPSMLLECNLCDFVTRDDTKLQKHSAVHEDPSKLLWYFCTKCNYKTKQKPHLRRHDLTHRELAELELFTCAICQYKFKQKCTLKRHINNVHSDHGAAKLDRNRDIFKIFKCKECSYSTYKKGLLATHMEKHKDVRDVSNMYICDICHFSTKYRRNLRVHLETHKESPQLQVFECKICRFKTRLGYCLKRHFLSKLHLRTVGKLEEYCPRSLKMNQPKKEEDSDSDLGLVVD